MKPRIPPSGAAPAIALCIALLWVTGAPAADARSAGTWALAIHGGSGVLPRERMTEKKEAAYRRKLAQALAAGQQVLETNGTSVDAVIAAVTVLEDSGLFNAGKGAVETRAGRVELDAAVMDGATLKAGAVASVNRIRNPVDLARRVMDESPHVLLVGDGAEAFARREGIKRVNRDYFSSVDGSRGSGHARRIVRLGTVGAVALDRSGHLAAATSTGGLSEKWPGRVGDSPLIGAGTYADDATCAVSATGHGESFMRTVAAHDIAALVGYRGMPLAQAARLVVMGKLPRIDGDGGVIAVDRQGNIAMPFNTRGMYRGSVREGGKPQVAIYAD